MKVRSGRPGKPVPPVAPDLPDDADLADPGEMATVKAEQIQQRKGKYGATPVVPFRAPQAAGAPTGPARQPQEPGAGSAEKKQDGWIEMELRDDAGAVVPGEKYEIEVPDGRVADGTLDEKGWDRIDGFEPGECVVRFPNLDREAWHLVESNETPRSRQS